MSELKVIKAYLPSFDADHNDMLLVSHTRETYATAKQIECYTKSDADKVIADLEESHKMKVEQLLMEIVKLKTENIRFRKRLFRMCARLGKMGYLAFHNVQAKLKFYGDDKGVARAKMLRELWYNVACKCMEYADKFKEG